MVEGMADAAGVFYNYSGALSCFDFDSGPNPETTEVSDFWGYQYCTEQFQLFSKDGGGIVQHAESLGQNEDRNRQTHALLPVVALCRS
jgi:hypothetical protein